jgi:hypothetical protein
VPPVPVGFDEEAEMGSVDETPVGRGIDPVPGAEKTEEVPLPYGAELEGYGGRPPVPVPVPGKYEDDGTQGMLTETVTVVGGSLTTTVSVTVVMYWYCLFLMFLGWMFLCSWPKT